MYDVLANGSRRALVSASVSELQYVSEQTERKRCDGHRGAGIGLIVTARRRAERAMKFFINVVFCTVPGDKIFSNANLALRGPIPWRGRRRERRTFDA